MKIINNNLKKIFIVTTLVISACSVEQVPDVEIESSESSESGMMESETEKSSEAPFSIEPDVSEKITFLCCNTRTGVCIVVSKEQCSKCDDEYENHTCDINGCENTVCCGPSTGCEEYCHCGDAEV